MEDDWNFDNVPVRREQEEAKQQNDEDVDLPPPNNAALFMPAKLDLTDDKVDWKKLEEEDKRLATEVARRQNWDIDRLWAPDWCAACSLMPMPTSNSNSNRQSVAREVFTQCERAVATLYGKSKMDEVCKAVRDVWIQTQLERMEAGENESTAAVKFWSCRQVYEHLHDHNVTEYVKLVQDARRYNAMERELNQARKRVDPLTGIEVMDYKAIRELRSVNKENRAIQAELRKASQRAERHFFLVAME